MMCSLITIPVGNAPFTQFGCEHPPLNCKRPLRAHRCAGEQCRVRETAPEEDFRRQFETNFWGLYYVSKALPVLKRQRARTTTRLPRRKQLVALEKFVEERRRFIRDADDLVRCLTIEFEIELNRQKSGVQESFKIFAIALGGIHQPSHSISNWFSWSDASSGIQWLAPSICS
jgi:NAD(P)-dependent dehydrogenase (short-subunit alcohol dehydrogenase family)